MLMQSKIGFKNTKHSVGTSRGGGSLQTNFFSISIDKLVEQYLKQDNKLDNDGFEEALSLFHQAAEGVPAYKDFLKKHKIDHTKVKTQSEFREVPIIDKKNYLRSYPLKALCWSGKLNDLYILSSSSGSTGEPFIWPRGEEQELEGALNFEVIFNKIFRSDEYSSLYLNCFSMGTWISGPFVLACAEYLTRKGYPILTVTPALDKGVTFSLLKNLAPSFDQIVISGYPPFIKDLLDAGQSNGINWKKYQVKFLFAAEGFSEEWRNYIHRMVGSQDSYSSSVNIYGSADAGILAHETPTTTLIRRNIANKKGLTEALFSDTRMPTLAQYDPRLKYFEEVEAHVIFTTRSGIPLIRYSIGDDGGVMTFREMDDRVSGLGFDLSSMAKKILGRKALWRLPFVYVFGRADFTVSLYGLLIYPEHIKFGLEHSGLSKAVSGKFVMSIEYDGEQNQYLLVRIELAEGTKKSIQLANKVQNCIVEGLQKVNSEYRKLMEAIGSKALPMIELVENGNVDYFRPGAKQRWVKKN